MRPHRGGPFRFPVAWAAVFVLAASAAQAQAVFKGRILASQTRHPLVGADVILEDLQQTAATNDSGYFRLANIPLGAHPLRVRRIGFKSAVTTLRVEAPDSLIVEIDMEAWVAELEPLYSVAKPHRAARLDEFEERRAHGLGQYIGTADLRANEHRTLAALLHDRGLRVQVTGFSEQLLSPSGCAMKVVLDGTEIHSLGYDPTLYPVANLGAVEIYKRAAEVPIQFSPTGNLCGVVLLWTRDR